MTQWISVEERLPEEGKSVLIWNKWVGDCDENPHIAHWSYWYPKKNVRELVWHESFNEGYASYTPTHWMPLPERPK